MKSLWLVVVVAMGGGVCGVGGWCVEVGGGVFGAVQCLVEGVLFVGVGVVVFVEREGGFGKLGGVVVELGLYVADVGGEVGGGVGMPAL